MTTCEKHGCELKELFTSSYCELCDLEQKFDRAIRDTQEAAVNADVSKIMKHVYSHDADGKELQFGSPHHTHDAGWYHNYPVCGTDANGSDVDDMDVCMGLKAVLGTNAQAFKVEQRMRQARAAFKALQGR